MGLFILRTRLGSGSVQLVQGAGCCIWFTSAIWTRLESEVWHHYRPKCIICLPWMPADHSSVFQAADECRMECEPCSALLWSPPQCSQHVSQYGQVQTCPSPAECSRYASQYGQVQTCPSPAECSRHASQYGQVQICPAPAQCSQILMITNNTNLNLSLHPPNPCLLLLPRSLMLSPSPHFPPPSPYPYASIYIQLPHTDDSTGRPGQTRRDFLMQIIGIYQVNNKDQ